ncbi:cuticle protein 19-like [Wyeomyia smithii]|uniref:cuticle protein 19-like n=1 Tax=Wyeomyia smithii TaxID=174621 RepID=UPI002467F571|nr:cuticle protein 19-like [Wyeomyia smithii]
MIKITHFLVACLLAATVLAKVELHHGPIPYKFQYGVNDGHTGDHKTHWEHREGDRVIGQYTVAEADGTHRVVQYKSDPTTGFQAHVKREGHAKHPHGQSYANIDQFH